jgi:GntR family transcriptional regulator, rspAB operon transcriptional repressor
MIPDNLYTLLFDRIVRGEYNAGTWLREEALAEEFNVSRTPVREALRQLTQDGLMQMVPKRGCRSLGFTVDDLEEAYAIRHNLELLAVERALPTMSLDTLMPLRGEIARLTDSDDPLEHSRLDGKFHTLIMEAAGGKRLTMMLTSLYRIMASFRELGYAQSDVRQQALTEHLAIIDALVARDGDLAAGTLSEHIKATRSRVLATVIKRGV